MTSRDFDRVQYAMRVRFRTPSSFLIAYSVNLSRGGIFLETRHAAPVGAAIKLELEIPGASTVTMIGVVSWRREEDDSSSPPGLGIEFRDDVVELDSVIDKLVGAYNGLSLLLLCGDDQDRGTLTRLVRSIISTAEVISAGDAHLAEALLDEDIDIAVIDADYDPDAALETIRLTKKLTRPVPVIALASTKKLSDLARAAGADEIATNPPAFAELQQLLVRALIRPAAIETA